MHNSDTRQNLIEVLSETPFINYACKKVGLSRATFYRWMKDNCEFKRVVTKAIEQGRLQCGEIAETALLKKIKEGSMDAIKFYLTHNDPRYIPKRSVSVEPLSEKERVEYNRLKEKDEYAYKEVISPEREEYSNELLDAILERATDEERAKLLDLITKEEEVEKTY